MASAHFSDTWSLFDAIRDDSSYSEKDKDARLRTCFRERVSSLSTASVTEIMAVIDAWGITPFVDFLGKQVLVSSATGQTNVSFMSSARYQILYSLATMAVNSAATGPRERLVAGSATVSNSTQIRGVLVARVQRHLAEDVIPDLPYSVGPPLLAAVTGR